MEAKFLASVFSFLSIFLAINAQSNESNLSKEAYKYGGSILSAAIYYGDSNVKIGDPFSITCIISINNPIHWLKDDEPITRHNLRHGRDEHSYVTNENPIEGEKHKIEAQISVKHALKVHEGKYRCNDVHSNYHILRVHVPLKEPRPHTQSPFIILSGQHNNHQNNNNNNNNNNNKNWTPYEPTESISIYETINDLMPSSNLDDNIFTNKWDKHAPTASVLPTQQIAIVTSTIRQQTSMEQQQQQKHHQNHMHHQHHYHNHHNQQHKQQHHLENDKSKNIYINTSGNNFDGISSTSNDDSNSHEHMEYVNVGYQPLNNNYNGTSSSIRYSATPPVIPPPRIATTITPYYKSTQEQQQIQQQLQLQTQQVSTTRFPLQTFVAGTHHTSTMHKTFHKEQQQQQLSTHTPTWNVASTSGGTLYATHAATSAAAHVPTSSSTTKEPTTELLVPNYDNAELKLKSFVIRQPLMLNCNVTQPGFKLTWEKNGTDVALIKELQGRYRILVDENQFSIDKTNPEDDGLYSCVANNQRKDFNVYAKVMVGVPSNVGVVEGEKLSITCTVVGTNPELTWVVNNVTISNSTQQIKLKEDNNGVKNAILTIDNVTMNDRGLYECIGNNSANKSERDTCNVRVKDKFAALWPFLGICAEVMILCTIILIYEKRRNKTELEESDTDPQEH